MINTVIDIDYIPVDMNINISINIDLNLEKLCWSLSRADHGCSCEKE